MPHCKQEYFENENIEEDIEFSRLLMSRVVYVMEKNGCEYIGGLPNDFCYFSEFKFVAIDRKKLGNLAKEDKYKEIDEYILELVKDAKRDPHTKI